MTISSNKTLKALRGLLLATTMLASPLMATAPQPAAAQIAITVQIEPPVLPVYDQPPLPEPGYIWTPGYWAYDGEVGYYWVPGTWVQPPEANFLWTPAYWGWADGAYVFHEGYWGPHVGFYGGINYGFGYGGIGYEGGRWENGNFAYNRTVNNFGETHITNVYESRVTVVNNTRVSFNGGTNGVNARPTQTEIAAEHEHHVPPPAVQREHIAAAAKDPQLSAKQNGGHPAIAATARPAQFHGPGVVPAHAATGERPPAGAGAERVSPTHEPVVRPEQRAIPPHEPASRAPEQHPAPAAREPAARPQEHVPPPARQPASRAPEQHSAPAPAARPAQHPAAQAPHPANPAPAARPAPPPPHPAQAAPHPAPKKDEGKKPPEH